MSIPIRNIYFMLLYAWNRLDEAGVVEVSADKETSLINLFARILAAGTRHLLKRGLDRGYIPYSEDIRGVKGKICFSDTLKRQLIPSSKLHCEFDELNYNVLHNQILKATINLVVLNKNVDRQIRDELVGLSRRLHDIEPANLAGSIFSRVYLHRNNSFYGFLMSVCKLIYNAQIISEDPGDAKFSDFQRDKDMPQVFEDFVRNFYKIEIDGKYDGYRTIGSEYILWDTANSDCLDNRMLPIMKTDISIKTPNGYLIIDTKYYQKTLAEYFDSKLHSSNLYQLFSYLKNIEKKGPDFKYCSGMLLYPTVKKHLNSNYEIQGHTIKVRTIDLSMNWQDIHKSLLNLVGAASS